MDDVAKAMAGEDRSKRREISARVLIGLAGETTTPTESNAK